MNMILPVGVASPLPPHSGHASALCERLHIIYRSLEKLRGFIFDALCVTVREKAKVNGCYILIHFIHNNNEGKRGEILKKKKHTNEYM